MESRTFRSFTSDPSRCIVAVTGLKREARLLRRYGLGVLIGGGSGTGLMLFLLRALEKGPTGMLSIGIAGGLRPGLKPGTPIVASGVVAGEQRLTPSGAWARRLKAMLPDAVVGDVAGEDRIVGEPGAKESLGKRTGALAVDMESHIVAQVAAPRGVPWAVLRIVADPAERRLPPAAQAGFAPNGSVRVGHVLAALLASPTEVPDLMRSARDAGQALSALARCCRLIRPGFGFPKPGESVFDLP